VVELIRGKARSLYLNDSSLGGKRETSSAGLGKSDFTFIAQFVWMRQRE